MMFRFDLRVKMVSGGRHGNPLQYPCLENPMDNGAWRAPVHRIVESDTTEVTSHTHIDIVD